MKKSEALVRLKIDRLCSSLVEMLLTEMIKPDENKTGVTLLITILVMRNVRTWRGQLEKVGGMLMGQNQRAFAT